MSGKSRKWLLSALLSALIASLLSGCFDRSAATQSSSPSGDGKSPPAGEVKTLNLTMFNQWGEPFVDPQNDVIKPLIEAKGWKINVSDHSYESGQNWTEKLNLFVASDTLPDVFEFPAGGVDSIDKYADKFVDLTDILKDPAKVPNLSKYLNAKTLELLKTKDSKKNLFWPTSLTPDWTDPTVVDANKELYTTLHTTGSFIRVREDVLTQLGYKFTPVDVMQKQFDPSKRMEPNAVKIEPEIRTIADFEKLLNGIKNLNLKTKNGSNVIPLGGFDPEFAFGTSFGFDFFRNYNGKVDGYYGAPFAKDMHQILNKWVRAGLFDKDTYLLAKQGEQIDNKIALGDFGAWIGGSEQGIKNFEDTYKTRVRYIPMPKYKDDLTPYQDGMYPGSGQGLLIRKGYKDVDKLIQYLDWLYSDEAQDIIMWGKEGGVWEMKDGKKVFKDPELWDVIKSRQANKKTGKNQDAGYFGLYDTGKGFYTSSYTRGFIANGNVNKSRYELNYPPQYDFAKEMQRLAGYQTLSTDGQLLYAYGSEANKFNNYFWSKGWEINNGKLVLSKSDGEFEQNWKSIYDEYMNSGNYAQAMKDVEDRYKILTSK